MQRAGGLQSVWLEIEKRLANQIPGRYA